MRSLALFLLAVCAAAQDATVLKPARVFDGETSHEGWAVRVRAGRIEAAGPAASIDTAGAKVVDLPGGGRPTSDINVTPLVDVVLVLLIIFMVVTPLLEKDIEVRIPNTEEIPEEIEAPPDQI